MVNVRSHNRINRRSSPRLHTLTCISSVFKVNHVQKELTDHIDDSKVRFGRLGKEIQIIQSNHVTEISECRRSSAGLDQRLSKLEGVCGRLDSFSDSLEKIREGLSRHVSGLWTCVNGLNATVTTQGDRIDNIQNVQLERVHSNIHRLNSSVLDLTRQFHNFLEQDYMGESQQPEVMGSDFWMRDSARWKGGKVRVRRRRRGDRPKEESRPGLEASLKGPIKSAIHRKEEF